MILDNAPEKITRYNELCIHYNLVANSVYSKRNEYESVFNSDFQPFLIAALIVFDMGRWMGNSATMRYDAAHSGFAARLRNKLDAIQPYVNHLLSTNLTEINLEDERENICRAYSALAADGVNGLHQNGCSFHVGATKLLHFLNPEFFIIIDRKVARALRAEGMGLLPYSAKKYFACLTFVQNKILNFPTDFCALETGTPIARIFDKCAFATGANWL